MHDITCFHCQQVAEKYLKALLQELGQPVPRTHDLEQLLLLLLPHDAALRLLKRGLHGLTPFAVDFSYPRKRASKRQTQTAFRVCSRVREAIRRRLGLPV